MPPLWYQTVEIMDLRNGDFPPESSDWEPVVTRKQGHAALTHNSDVRAETKVVAGGAVSASMAWLPSV